MNAGEAKTSWTDSVRALFHPCIMAMLFLGFSAGLPILLIFSSLSLWLREAGVERAAVTFFSWAALGYSFKFVWAPLVDRLPVPFLTRLLGRRRAWILVAQLAIMAAICVMAFTDPARLGSSLTVMALAAVLLGFSSATQDIVVDAYRIESANTDLQALMSATYIAGYRIGMLVAGAGALYLASYFGSETDSYRYEAWKFAYLSMALVMLVGVMTTLIIDEPRTALEDRYQHDTRQYLRFLGLFFVCVVIFISVFAVSSGSVASSKLELTQMFGNKFLSGFLVETFRMLSALCVTSCVAFGIVKFGLVDKEMVMSGYVEPIRDFFSRYGVKTSLLLLALVGLYRISDIVLGVISNVFYQDVGFTKTEIATTVKLFGLWMTLLGGFLGGILSIQFGVMRILFLGALLSMLTNVLFILLAEIGPDLRVLYAVISADNLSGGIAVGAFIAFLSSLTNVKFTAIQYAIFSSLMTLLPKIFGGYSGTVVDTVGYSQFFLGTAVLGIPVLGLVWMAAKKLELTDNGQTQP